MSGAHVTRSQQLKPVMYGKGEHSRAWTSSAFFARTVLRYVSRVQSPEPCGYQLEMKASAGFRSHQCEVSAYQERLLCLGADIRAPSFIVRYFQRITHKIQHLQTG